MNDLIGLKWSSGHVLLCILLSPNHSRRKVVPLRMLQNLETTENFTKSCMFIENMKIQIGFGVGIASAVFYEML